jgi:hypothetical protein
MKNSGIENNEVLKEILKDSFGGIMYNVANAKKYDTKELLKEWEALSEAERESASGLIKGAIEFITENL